MTSRLPASSDEFRKVLFTGLYSQVVLMTIPVGGDIGDEVHTVDQALTFTQGKGKATIAGKDQDVEAGDLMVVPAGTQHQFVNTGDSPLVCFATSSLHLVALICCLEILDDVRLLGCVVHVNS